MKYTELYRLQKDGSQTVVLRCQLSERGEVQCEGDRAIRAYLEKEGIEDYTVSGGPTLFPKDGLRFLEQLSYNFSSGYLNASEVKEE